MKKSLKSVLSLALCIVLLSGSVAIGGSGIINAIVSPAVRVSAVDEASGSFAGGTWTLNNKGVLTVCASGEISSNPFNDDRRSDVVEIVLVNSEGTDGIKKITNGAFSGYQNVADVSVPDSVTEIDSGAFSGCTSLEKVKISEASSLERIGENSFNGCSSLKSFYFPAGLKAVSSGAFGDCSSLAEVDIAEGSKLSSIGNGTFSGCSALTYFDFPATVRAIGSGAFSSSGLKEVVLPEGLMTISSGSFCYSSNLEKVFIPASVTIIGSTAFKNCISLDEVEFGAGSELNQISNSFDNCTSLESIIIPASIRIIDKGAFSGCSKLKTVYCAMTKNEWDNITKHEDSFPSDTTIVTSLDKTIFAYEESEEEILIKGVMNGYKEIIIPAAIDGKPVTGIVSLRDTNGMKKLIIPDNVKSIGEKAFMGCTNLTEVIIIDSCESIGESAFEGCEALTKIDFGKNSSLESIEEATFKNCTSLQSIYIPDSVKKINSSVFEGCTSLTAVTGGNGTKNVCSDSFPEDCANITVTSCPSSSLYSEAYKKGCNCVAEHNYSVKVEKVKSTCVNRGYTVYSCICGKTEKRDFTDLTSHEYVEHEGKAATCTTAGWEPYRTCSNCEYTSYKPIPKTGHSFTNYIYNNDATLEHDGTKTAICDNGCGAEKTIYEEGTMQALIDAAEAERVAGMIAALDENVELDDKEQIENAVRAYNNLTADQQTILPGETVARLNAIEGALNKKINDKEAADAVIAKINAIGEVTRHDGQKVAEARSAFNALTAEQQILVDNASVLETAEQQMEVFNSTYWCPLCDWAEEKEANLGGESFLLTIIGFLHNIFHSICKWFNATFSK